MSRAVRALLAETLGAVEHELSGAALGAGAVHANLDTQSTDHAAQPCRMGGLACFSTLANVAYGFKIRLGHDPAILDQIGSALKDKGIGA